MTLRILRGEQPLWNILQDRTRLKAIALSAKSHDLRKHSVDSEVEGLFHTGVNLHFIDHKRLLPHSVFYTRTDFNRAGELPVRDENDA